MGVNALGERPREVGSRAVRRAAWTTSLLLTCVFIAFMAAIFVVDGRVADLGTDAGMAAAVLFGAAFGAVTGLIAYRGGARAQRLANFAPQLLELMTVGVVMTDAEYRITYANGAFARML